MKPAQEWQQPFVVTAGIEELFYDPLPSRSANDHDHIRILVSRTPAATDDIHEIARAL